MWIDPGGFVVWGFVGLVLAGGLALVAAGLRGRRIDNHPVCRRCGFDLVGIYPAAGRCTDCGASTEAVGAVRLGNRRRRPRMVWAGAVVLFLGAMLGTAAAGLPRLEENWRRFQSTEWLIDALAWEDQLPSSDEYGWMDDRWGVPSARELLNRYDRGAITHAQLDKMIEAVLRRQADRSKRWHPEVGDLFERAMVDGLCTAVQRMRYVRQAKAFELWAQRRTHPGGLVNHNLHGIDETRVGRSGAVHFVFELKSARIDGEPVPLVELEFNPELGKSRIGEHTYSGPLVMRFGFRSMSHWSGSLPVRIRRLPPIDVRPGRHELAVTYLLHAVEDQQATEAFTSWEQEFTATIEVRRPDQRLVDYHGGPDNMGMMKNAVSFHNLGARNMGRGHWIADWRVRLEDPMLPLAHDVYWRVGPDEWFVGTLIASRNQRGGTGQSTENIPLIEGPVDVILRPNDRLAAEQGFTEIFGMEMVFEALPVSPTGP
jgi:hypothetical protein